MSIFAFTVIGLGIVFWLSRRPGMNEGMRKGLRIVTAILFLLALATLGYMLYLVT